MRPRFLAIRLLIGTAAAMLTASMTAAAPVAAAGQDTGRCYDQLGEDLGLSNTSDKYEPEFHVYDNRAADDFVLTKGCRIRSIDVIGTFFDGVGPPESEQVTLYVDGGGTPGTRLTSQRVIGTYVYGQGSFHLILNHPVVLGPGNYWLSVRANMIFAENGQWGWNSIDHQVGALPVWKNPLDGFETGCTTYQPLYTCVDGEQKWYLGLGFAINSSKELVDRTAIGSPHRARLGLTTAHPSHLPFL